MGLFKRKNEDDPEADQRLVRECETVRAILRHYSPGTRLHFGAPSRCPNCGDYGFVQGVNKLEGSSHNHCFGCQADWVITVQALRAVESEPVAPRALPPLPTATVQALTPIVAAPPRPLLSSVPTAVPTAVPLTPREPAAVPVAAVPVADVPAAVPAAEPATPEPAIAVVPPAPVAPEPDGVEIVLADPPPAPKRRLRALVVESNPFDLGVLEELAEMADPVAIDLLPAATRAEAERLAATTEHDVVLLNLELPDSTGIATLLEWQHSGISAAPVIILSGNGQSPAIGEARSLGIVHFIQKDQLDELVDLGSVGADRFARLLRQTVKRAASHPRGT
jgi:CheY-like chemotaxis protein